MTNNTDSAVCIPEPLYPGIVISRAWLLSRMKITRRTLARLEAKGLRPLETGTKHKLYYSSDVINVLRAGGSPPEYEAKYKQ